MEMAALGPGPQAGSVSRGAAGRVGRDQHTAVLLLNEAPPHSASHTGSCQAAEPLVPVPSQPDSNRWSTQVNKPPILFPVPRALRFPFLLLGGLCCGLKLEHGAVPLSCLHRLLLPGRKTPAWGAGASGEHQGGWRVTSLPTEMSAQL